MTAIALAQTTVDEEVAFGAGAYRFEPCFPPGTARDRRPPRGNNLNRLQTLN